MVPGAPAASLRNGRNAPEGGVRQNQQAFGDWKSLR
jgi:hypothetical protein